MSGTITFSEDFEGAGGTAAMTTANTGFTTIAGGGLRQITGAHAQGSYGAQFTGYSFGSTYTAYAEHSFATSQNLVYMRFAFNSTGTTAGIIAIMGVSSGTPPAISIASGGYLTLSNNGSVVATTTNTFTINQWFLLEWSVDSTSTTQQLRLYSGLTGSPIETISGTYNQGSMTSGRIGVISPNISHTSFFDTYAEAYDDWIGPYGASPAGMTTAWLTM